MTDPRIEHYANAMFAHDTIHEEWVSKCAQYLISIFGSERLRDAVVLDYAFGRGNWSLAFLRAGARRVVAIDAAPSNVARFSAYCRTHAIHDVEVVPGNALERQPAGKFDVVWLYGILHHVADKRLLLERVRDVLADAASAMLVYCYNSGCLRQRIVTAARAGASYESAEAFGEDVMLFNPHARLRARDDLTAPLIDWCSADELTALLRQASLTPFRSVSDFPGFLGTSEHPEFSPHHFICRRADHAPSSTLVSGPGDMDHQVIGNLADWIVSRAADEKKQFAIGLFNTHFPALRHHGYTACVVENYQYLLFCWRKLGLNLPDDSTMATYLEAGLAAVAGRKACFPEDVLRQSELARYISNHPIRL